MTPYVLLALAVVLAWPVPVLLGRAPWPSRAPVTAIILWQTVGLAGGLSLITAPLSWGLRLYGDGLIAALTELAGTIQTHGLTFLSQDSRLGVLEIMSVTAGLLIGVHLIMTLVYSAIRTARLRRRHRQLVELLSRPGDFPEKDPTFETRVLPSAFPLAYCLPAFTGAFTVVSKGLIDQLSEGELKAVIAHETAHLVQRHDLLRLAFEAWHRATAWLSATETARTAVFEITEMLADDYALTKASRQDLISSVATVAGARDNSHSRQSGLYPGIQAGVQGSRDPHQLNVGIQSFGSSRIKRLLAPDPPLEVWKTVIITLAAALLLAIPAMITLWGI